MNRTCSRLVPLLFAGLVACGEDTAVADATTNDAATNDAAPMAVADAVPPTANAQAAPLANLPVKRGYYVASDTPCNQASNANTMFVHRKGINSAQSVCEFTKIEQTGPNTYRGTETCTILGEQGPPQASTATFTLSGDAAFSAKHDSGWEYTVRYCQQSSMPDPWRDNDISDETG